MRTWSIDGSVVTCVYESANYCGSMQYDFQSGELFGHKPENMSNLDWFRLVKNFMSVCRRMLETEQE